MKPDDRSYNRILVVDLIALILGCVVLGASTSPGIGVAAFFIAFAFKYFPL